MKRIFIALMIIALSVPVSAQMDDSDFDLSDAVNALNPPAMVLSGPDGHGDGVVGAIRSKCRTESMGCSRGSPWFITARAETGSSDGAGTLEESLPLPALGQHFIMTVLFVEWSLGNMTVSPWMAKD